MEQPQDTPASALAARYLSAEQAGELAGHTPQCVRHWCRRFGLGEFVAGRWWIAPERLDAFLAARRGGGHGKA